MPAPRGLTGARLRLTPSLCRGLRCRAGHGPLRYDPAVAPSKPRPIELDPLPEDLRLWAAQWPCGELLLASRAQLQRWAPELKERLVPGWKVLAFYAPSYVLVLAPYRGLRLGFEWGAALRDEAGLLELPGSRMGWYRLSVPADLTHPALPALVRQAVDMGTPPRLIQAALVRPPRTPSGRSGSP